MKLIKYIENWFEVKNGQSECKFAAGKHYPVTDETKAHAGRGIAEEVDAPDDVEKAEAAAEKASAKASEAATAAANAAAVAAAATAAAEVKADDAAKK